MSDDKSVALDMNKIVIKSHGTPILVKKENKIKLLQGERIIKNIKFGPASSLYQEDVIFESKPGDLRDSPVKVTITNRIDLLKNFTRTVITYFDQLNGKVLSEKTSDHIARFIGQSNYEAVIAALLTVTDEEVKIKAIMSLLTTVAAEDQTTQTISNEDELPEVKIKTEPLKTVEEKCCQTLENCMDLIFKFKQRRRVRRTVLTPYPIKDTPKKVIKKIVVNPTKRHKKFEDANKKPCDIISKSGDSKSDIVPKVEKEVALPVITEIDDNRIPKLGDPESNIVTKVEEEVALPVITDMLDDNSNTSAPPSLSGFSITEPALRSAEATFLLGIGKYTSSSSQATFTIAEPQKHYIELPNKEVLTVPFKPEFPYHIATPENLRSLNDEDKKKLAYFQAYLDFKHCLTRSADGCLPIHYAVLNNDLDLLKRQCWVLRRRNESLDITYGDLTPLQLSISQDTPQCTALLLQYGADPLLTDEEQRTCLHLASESSSDHLRAVINHCESNAKEILQDNELWKEEYDGKSNEILKARLLKHMCKMSDDQGYTPLMLAAKSGNYDAVRMLLEASPDCINLQMPNCGNTALFLAVEGACFDASNRGNKSKVADHYHRTISILLENHADITKPNHSGFTINDLLTDNINAELSMIFANKMTSRFFDGHLPGGSQFDNYMLLKNNEGKVDITVLKKTEMEIAETPTTVVKTESNDKDVNLSDLKITTEAAKRRIIVIPENKTTVMKNQQNIVVIKRGKKPTKKDKPIILENISIPQSTPILDLNSVNTQNVTFINPNDKLIRKTAGAKTVPSNKIKIVTSTSLANKRKIDEPGTSGKKVKNLKT